MAIAVGISGGQGIPRLTMEEMKAYLDRPGLDWTTDLVSVRLMVELPFWLLIRDSDLVVPYERTVLTAEVRGSYIEVQQGPIFLDSHANVVYLGPSDVSEEDKSRHLEKGAPYPISRRTKTVLVFHTQALGDALAAWAGSDVKRLNEASRYFHALALGHLPFANHIITSYRSASLDPYAYELSEWDAPVWYIEKDEFLVRTSILPYVDLEEYPQLGHVGSSLKSPVLSTCAEAVQAQLHGSITAGKHEMLDALSLFFRGRFADAVRIAVTAIEVALEAQYVNILEKKGLGTEQVQQRLTSTWNDFEGRLTAYQQESGRRLPGPMLHWVPYINGVRLKNELDWVRKLRHRVVHSGERINIFAQNTMRRAVETMVWLYEWFSSEDKYVHKFPGVQDFYAGMQGRLTHPIEYTERGVIVGNPDRRGTKPVLREQLIARQYAASVTEPDGDMELFAKMTLTQLGFPVKDAPAVIESDPILRERYRFDVAGETVLVFCLKHDVPITVQDASAIATRVLCEARQGTACRALGVVHHQRGVPVGLRETKDAISDQVIAVAEQCGITLVTAVDLMFLMFGAMQFKWDVEPLRHLLRVPGRQAGVPPQYREVGSYAHFYQRHSALIVKLLPGETVSEGDVLAVRLRDRYHEEPIASLRENGKQVKSVSGPNEAGIKVTLRQSDFRDGQPVYLRLPNTETAPPSSDEAETDDGAPLPHYFDDC